MFSRPRPHPPQLTLDVKYWLRRPDDRYLHPPIKTHNLEKWHRNRITNNEFLFVFKGRNTYLLYIILIFKKYIFIYLWIQQKRRCTGNTSHSKSRWKGYLHCSPNRYQGLKRGLGWGMRRGRRQEHKEIHPKMIKGQQRLKTTNHLNDCSH